MVREGLEWIREASVVSWLLLVVLLTGCRDGGRRAEIMLEMRVVGRRRRVVGYEWVKIGSKIAAR